MSSALSREGLSIEAIFALGRTFEKGTFEKGTFAAEMACGVRTENAIVFALVLIGCSYFVGRSFRNFSKKSVENFQHSIWPFFAVLGHLTQDGQKHSNSAFYKADHLANIDFHSTSF